MAGKLQLLASRQRLFRSVHHNFRSALGDRPRSAAHSIPVALFSLKCNLNNSNRSGGILSFAKWSVLSAFHFHFHSARRPSPAFTCSSLERELKKRKSLKKGSRECELRR